MALREQVLNPNKTTVAILDYTGSPNSLALSALVLGTARAPIVKKRDTQEVLVNSSSGASLYATPKMGVAAGHTIQLQVLKLDTGNDTDATVPTSFFRAAIKGDFTGTGFSDWTFTSPLSGGGAPAFKLVYTERSESGTTHVITVVVVATEIAEAAAGAAEAFTVTLLVLSDPTEA